MLSSYFFYYSFHDISLLILILSITGAAYFIGIIIHIYRDTKSSRYIYFAGIFLLLAILAYLKYTTFVFENLSALLGIEFNCQNILFESNIEFIGVSYYMFQAVSYITDIKNGSLKAEKNIINFSLYLAFFPKLLQGPIERGASLLPQFRSVFTFSYENTRKGLLLILWGLLKKVIIADNLALLVNPVYNNVYDYSGISFIGATIVYAFQLYFDFSGYTDIAIGSGLLFNIKLSKNFNLPYLATSISDFWRRWHISFSSWLLDYIFMPLQVKLKRLKIMSPVIALLVTFLICGLWHGANWNYIVWGLINGIYLSFSLLTRESREKLAIRTGLAKYPGFHRAIQVIITFSLVCFSWIFFRANSLSDALYIVSNLFSDFSFIDIFSNIMRYLNLSVFFLYDLITDMMGDNPLTLIFLIIYLPMLLAAFFYFLYSYIKTHNSDIFNKPIWFRWLVYFSLVLILITFWIVTDNPKFIYMKF